MGTKEGSALNCTPCPAGYHSSANNTDCAICPNGTASKKGSEKCTPCDGNSFAAKVCMSFPFHLMKQLYVEDVRISVKLYEGTWCLAEYHCSFWSRVQFSSTRWLSRSPVPPYHVKAGVNVGVAVSGCFS